MVPAIGEPAVSAAMHSREEDRAIEELKEIADQHLKGLKCELHTRFAALKGLAKAINQVAVEVDADLIVLKTHGRHGFARCERACADAAGVDTTTTRFDP